MRLLHVLKDGDHTIRQILLSFCKIVFNECCALTQWTSLIIPVQERKSTTNDKLERYLPDITRCSTLQPHGFESNPHTNRCDSEEKSDWHQSWSQLYLTNTYLVTNHEWRLFTKHPTIHQIRRRHYGIPDKIVSAIRLL